MEYLVTQREQANNLSCQKYTVSNFSSDSDFMKYLWLTCDLFFRVMILKNPPQVFCTGGALSQVIGAPQDYSKNRDSSHFPDDEDIHIPLPKEEKGNKDEEMSEKEAPS